MLIIMLSYKCIRYEIVYMISQILHYKIIVLAYDIMHIWT